MSPGSLVRRLRLFCTALWAFLFNTSPSSSSPEEKDIPRYGGQAVMEGVMMKGKKSVAVALKGTDGDERVIRRDAESSLPEWLRNAPFVRGVFILGDMMTHGMWALNESVDYYAEQHFEEEEEEDLPPWVDWLVFGFSFILFLFVFKVLPSWAAEWLAAWQPMFDGLVQQNLVEGFIRLGIFASYVGLLWRVDDFRRLFGYHGAEHTAINAFEDDQERYQEMDFLKGHSRIHPRCGTSFVVMLIVLALVLYTLADWALLAPTQAWGWTAADATWPNLWVRAGVRIIGIIPLIGISYEITKNVYKLREISVLRPVINFSMLFQHLTTAEPDEQMLDASLKSLNAVREVEEPESAGGLLMAEEIIDRDEAPEPPAEETPAYGEQA